MLRHDVDRAVGRYADDEAEWVGKSLADIDPFLAEVVGAIDSDVILLIDDAVGRVAHELVCAAVDIVSRGALSESLPLGRARWNAIVARFPRLSAINAVKDATDRHTEQQIIRLSGIRADGMQAHPAAAFPPLDLAVVVVKPRHRLPALPTVVGTVECSRGYPKVDGTGAGAGNRLDVPELARFDLPRVCVPGIA